MDYYTFGVEIEAIVEPHQIRSLQTKERMKFYFDKLAKALRKQALKAQADDPTGRYRKHSEHYDKWFITRDGSLRDVPQNHGMAGKDCVEIAERCCFEEAQLFNVADPHCYSPARGSISDP